jgi:hypothetical protein
MSHRLKATCAVAFFFCFTKESWFPTLDNLRNLFLRPRTEMLSFFQQLREAL